jgi:hypothetical protein
VFRLKRNPYNKGNWSVGDINVQRQVSSFKFKRNLPNSFITDAENALHPIEETHSFFTRISEEFLCPYWQQSIQCCVSVPPNFLGYSNKPFLREITTEMSPARWSPEIAVAPSCWNRQFLICRHCPKADMFPVANASFVPKLRYQSLYCCLTLCFLVRINASQTAANDFVVKQRSITNIHCARENTVFASAQLLWNWLEQRPSNKGDLESSTAVRMGTPITQGWPRFRFNFCTVVRDCCWVAL